jgi:hypothetical protein
MKPRPFKADSAAYVVISVKNMATNMKLCMVVLLLVAVAYATQQECGNGGTCPTSHTCVGSSPLTGFLHGCMPAGTQMCDDARFACPVGHVCKADTCVHSATQVSSELVKMADQVPSTALSSSSGVAVCDIVRPHLPSYCTCVDNVASKTSVLDCQVKFLSFGDVGIRATLVCIPLALSLSRSLATYVVM